METSTDRQIISTLNIIEENTIIWKSEAKKFLQEWYQKRTFGQNFSLENDEEIVLTETENILEFDDFIDDAADSSGLLGQPQLMDEFASYENKQKYNRNSWAKG